MRSGSKVIPIPRKKTPDNVSNEMYVGSPKSAPRTIALKDLMKSVLDEMVDHNLQIPLDDVLSAHADLTALLNKFAKKYCTPKPDYSESEKVKEGVGARRYTVFGTMADAILEESKTTKMIKPKKI